MTSEGPQLEYKCSDLYHAGAELTIAWNDPAIAISWPIANPTLSAKDSAGSPLRDVMERLPEYVPEPHAGSTSDRKE